MIISKKKYEKLNNELVDAKAKVDDAKKELDDENKIMRATLLIKEQRDQFKTENEKLRERNKKLEKRNNQKVRRYLRGGLQQRRIEDLENKYNGMIAERNSLIDDLSWYKAKVSRLEDEKERFKEIKQEKEQLEESFQYQLEKRLEYFNKYQELKKENAQLKEKNGKLQEVIEGKNSDLLFTEDENKQLKESRDWDYEYIVKVNEENKALRLQSDTYFEQWQQHKALNSEISQHIGNKPSSSTYKYFRGKLNALEIREGD